MIERKPTKLLCTFCHPHFIESTLKTIRNTYEITNDSVFVFRNASDNDELILSYNVVREENFTLLPSTLILHRNKETGTLFTLNGLNRLIEKSNNGKLDVNYKIDWDYYENCLIVTGSDGLRLIDLKFLYKKNISNI
jgi:hypothetical protein